MITDKNITILSQLEDKENELVNIFRAKTKEKVGMDFYLYSHSELKPYWKEIEDLKETILKQERLVDKDISDMLDDIVRKFGHEDRHTIIFAEMIEIRKLDPLEDRYFKRGYSYYCKCMKL